ncbi:MAG: lipase maturation factor family protein, partial [Thermoanaerobaculia bacterium]
MMFEEFTAEAEARAARLPILERWFAPSIKPSFLRARWIWLRCLGAIFFSAFYSLYFQIHGLIGPHGILPAFAYLDAVRRAVGLKGYWLAPTLLWISSSDWMLSAIVWIGFVASVAIIFNLWPRLSIIVAGICFLSFIGAAQEFAGYQSDGMLLEAAFLSIFLAPRGFRPRMGIDQPPSRAAVFMLQWEWFRIYFESGLVKILSGEEQWRNLTAMDKYYENGPLPSWLGWYVQQWPHSFHAFSAGLTLVVELFVVWLLFVPRKTSLCRLIAFLIVTPLQIGIILTANYAFLNYLVLCIAILLLDDSILRGALPAPRSMKASLAQAIVLPAIFVTTIAAFMLPRFPTVMLLDPFRIANRYGLFAVMTRERIEIEFQGTRDGVTWIPYLFRYKPQDVNERPGLYAPYQPRFEWNLWFASLGSVQENQWVLNTEGRLLENSEPVLQLFASNPFAGKPPIAVRAVAYQYWFTTRDERART